MNKQKFSLPKSILSERIKSKPIGLTKEQKEAINKIDFKDKKLLRRIVRVFNIWDCSNSHLATRLRFTEISITIEVVASYYLNFSFHGGIMHIYTKTICDGGYYDLVWNDFCQYMFRYVIMNDEEKQKHDQYKDITQK